MNDPGESHDSADAATAPKPRVRILHAEDQPVVGDAIEMILNDAGYEVERAADGREALDKVTATPAAFGLVITDDNMPGLNGLELVRALRAMNFSGNVIVLSGVINEEKERHYRECGVRTIIEKPFQIPDLVAAVARELASA